jgi:hypothetical protein
MLEWNACVRAGTEGIGVKISTVRASAGDFSPQRDGTSTPGNTSNVKSPALSLHLNLTTTGTEGPVCVGGVCVGRAAMRLIGRISARPANRYGNSGANDHEQPDYHRLIQYRSDVLTLIVNADGTITVQRTAGREWNTMCGCYSFCYKTKGNTYIKSMIDILMTVVIY